MTHLSLFRVLLLFKICSLTITGTKADAYNCTVEIDLAFVVDSSGSICGDTGFVCASWNSLLIFMRDLVNDITVSEKNIRVAMVEFETSAVIRWNLTTYKDKAALLKAIENLPYIGGNTNTVAALDLLSTVFTTERGDRAGVRNTAILITDGKPRRGDDPIPLDEIRAAVQRVINLGIRLLVVGVTDSIDMETLKELSSPPHTIDDTVFIAENYSSIAEVSKQLEIQTCINYTDELTSTPAALCTEELDLCFVVDASGSICDSDPGFNYEVDETCNNWNLNVNFIRAIADSFDVGDQATRIGLVIFSTGSTVQWDLTAHTDKGELLDAISNLVYHKGGTTDMTGGLNLARTQVFGLSNNRPGVPDTAIIITDGYPTNPSTLEDEIVAFRKGGIRTLAVGVTDKVDLSTIQRLASQPPKEGETYFLAKNYQNLEESVRSQLSTRACLTPTGAPVSSPGTASSPTMSSTTTTPTPTPTFTTNTIIPTAAPPPTTPAILTTTSTTITDTAADTTTSPTATTTVDAAATSTTTTATTTAAATTTTTTAAAAAASTTTTTATSAAATTISTTTTTVMSNTTATLPATLIDITPSPNTGAPVCDDASLDLCFLVDASGSICDNDPNFHYNTDNTCNNWHLIVQFLRRLVDGIFDSQVTRIALVTFSTTSQVIFDLSKYTDKNELLTAVDSLAYVKGGTTDMTGALRLARTEVFNTTGDRQGFPNTAVMITDGYPTDPSTLQSEIDATHGSGIRVLALGVTEEVDETTLQRISSPPQQINVTYFVAVNYVDIDSFRKTLQEKICKQNL